MLFMLGFNWRHGNLQLKGEVIIHSERRAKIGTLKVLLIHPNFLLHLFADLDHCKMGSSEKFCLRWNDFQENISVAFRELRNDTDFFDVTLACSTDDGSSHKNSGLSDRDPGGKPRHKTVRAHKVILSACSVFFKDLLKSMNGGNTSQTQPLIYLRGIKYEDLQSILDFMYYGEVNIEQEKLNTFLAVAEELRVKGLSPSETGQGGGGSASQGESSVKRPFSANRSSPLVNSAKKARLIKRAKEEGMSAMADIKTEMRDTSPGNHFTNIPKKFL